MNELTPSITQPSQQPRNPIFCCLVNRERGRSSQPSDQVKLSRRDAARRGCFDIAGCLERGTYGQEWLETDRRLNACDGARRSVAALHRSRIRDAGTAGSTSAAGTSEPLSKARSWRTCVLSLSRSPSLNFGRPNTLPAARASGRTTTSSEIPSISRPEPRARVHPVRLKLSRRQADDRLLRLQFAIIIARGNLRPCRGQSYVPVIGLLLPDRT